MLDHEDIDEIKAALEKSVYLDPPRIRLVLLTYILLNDWKRMERALREIYVGAFDLTASKIACKALDVEDARAEKQEMKRGDNDENQD